jgi:DNA (cytosine-5)-methyltransferase 1
MRMDTVSCRWSVDVRSKVARLRRGGIPRLLDLFSGCGGLSLGFQSAGFRTDGAVELDRTAARTYAINFHNSVERYAKARDILSTAPEKLVADLNLGRKEQAFDLIVGGPPCQAFARIGRAKLREVADHPEAFRHDRRASLYLQYLAYVRELKPLALLMENVPDILNYAGHNIAEEMCETLSDLGYVCGYTLLSSAFYGVPQTRLRVILLGYHRELARPATFPNPTHQAVLPRGYQELGRFVRRRVGISLHHFIEPPAANHGLPPALTSAEAIGDLPTITAHLEGRLKGGPRRFNELAKYRTDIEPSRYAILMRQWPGFESGGGVIDHVIRYLPRDYAIFRRMAPGDEYPKALQLIRPHRSGPA